MLQEEDIKEIGKYNYISGPKLVTDDIEMSKQAPEHNRKVKEAASEEIPDHLVGLYENSFAGLRTEDKIKLRQLLVEFQENFSKNEWDLGLTHMNVHPINSGDAEPRMQPHRRVPLAYPAEEKMAIEDLKAKSVIRERLVLLCWFIKKDGGVRPCVDYRKVDALVKPDGYPLPKIRDCLDAVAGFKMFSSFDLTRYIIRFPLKRKTFRKALLYASSVILK